MIVVLTLPAVLAVTGGALIGLSRQINARLALSTSALRASWWNHVVGFVVLSLAGLWWGGLLPGDWRAIAWWAWFGGPLGVVFVAMGSWLIARIGAVATALLIIAGQMLTGVALDTVLGLSGAPVPRLAGALLILGGMAVLLRRP